MFKKFITLFFISSLVLGSDLRKKVVILDTGIEPNFPPQFLCIGGHKDFSGLGLNDTVKHGTHLAYILSSYINPKKECIVVVKFYNDKNLIHSTYLPEALAYIKTLHPDYLNMSFGGSFPFPEERRLIKDMLDDGTIMTVAAGNSGRDLNFFCGYYPACYQLSFRHKNYYVVGSCKDGKYEKYSNYNDPVNCCENGTQVWAGPYIFTGTSQSTAIKLGKIIRDN